VQNRGCSLLTETLLKRPLFHLRAWGRKLQQWCCFLYGSVGGVGVNPSRAGNYYPDSRKPEDVKYADITTSNATKLTYISAYMLLKSFVQLQKVLSEPRRGDLARSWLATPFLYIKSFIAKSRQTYISNPMSTMFSLIPGWRCLTDRDPVLVPEPQVPNQYIFSFMALPFFTYIIIFLLLD
jgi:hypothetical protein